MKNVTLENKVSCDESIKPCNTTCSFCFLNYTDTLQANYLFRGLQAEIIGEIIKTIRHQVRSYQKGEIIAYSGDICNILRIIVKGSVVGEMTDFQGKSLRIETLKSPNTIASAFLFGDNNTLPVNITALEETKLLLIRKQDLMELFLKNETILKNYLDIISNRSQLLTKKIRLLGMHSIRGKIAHYFLEQVSKDNTSEFVLKHSQNELANMFGITRPSLARVIREMHNEGIISANGRKIRILDKKAINQQLNERT